MAMDGMPMGGTVEEEMEVFKAIVEIVVERVQRHRAAVGSANGA
jgi:hypothetical protein